MGGMATMVFVVLKWIFGRPTAWQQLSLLIRIPSLANSSVMAMLVVEVSREIGQWLQQTGVAVTSTHSELVIPNSMDQGSHLTRQSHSLLSLPFTQNGKRIDRPNAKIPGVSGNSQTAEYCSAQKSAFGDEDDFTKKGGLKTMGEALGRGVVLTVSLWDDIAVNMNWLDSIGDTSLPEDAPGNRRGPCGVDDGKPLTLRTEHPDAHYSFESLKFGDIGSTNPEYPDPNPPQPSPPAPHPPTPSPLPTPGPDDCPGGSLSACIAICPRDPTSVYEVCVQTCLARCPDFQV